MDKRSRVKAKDVALVANVSMSAVSRTFTPGASVAPDTRARVLAVADALGYRPNILARGLTTQRTRLIGVVMMKIDSPFFERFLSRLNHALAAEGHRTLLLLIQSREEADEALEHALDYSVDGLIFVTSAPSPEASHRAHQASVPVVVMDRGDAPAFACSVWTDAAAIGRKVADIFLAEGRSRAAAISGFRGSPQPKELVAFAAAMEAATGRPTRMIEGGPSYDDGAAAAHQLMSGTEPPDCVFTATDYVAIGLHDAARLDLGIQSPRDLSIIGLGDTPQTAWRSHNLSTVRPPIDALVGTAIATLMARIEQPDLAAVDVVIDGEVIRRGTTLPATAAVSPAP